MAWLSSVPDEHLFIAAVTFGELQRGVEITREQDSVKAEAIEAWVDGLAQTRSVLPMDAIVFRRWSRLMHRRSDAVLEDAMIAATAMVHGLTVVTRNTRDFRPFGVATFDPFSGKA
jgi:hypothetical protein